MYGGISIIRHGLQDDSAHQHQRQVSSSMTVLSRTIVLGKAIGAPPAAIQVPLDRPPDVRRTRRRPIVLPLWCCRRGGAAAADGGVEPSRLRRPLRRPELHHAQRNALWYLCLDTIPVLYAHHSILSNNILPMFAVLIVASKRCCILSNSLAC